MWASAGAHSLCMQDHSSLVWHKEKEALITDISLYTCICRHDMSGGRYGWKHAMHKNFMIRSCLYIHVWKKKVTQMSVQCKETVNYSAGTFSCAFAELLGACISSFLSLDA